jgi:hypothetical protein
MNILKSKEFFYLLIIVFAITSFLPFGEVMVDDLVIANTPILANYFHLFYNFSWHLLEVIIPHIFFCLLISWGLRKLWINMNRNKQNEPSNIYLYVRKIISNRIVRYVVIGTFSLIILFIVSQEIKSYKNSNGAKENIEKADDESKKGHYKSDSLSN